MSKLKEAINTIVETNLGEVFGQKAVNFKITEANRTKGYAAVHFTEEATGEQVLMEFAIMKGGAFGTKILLGAETSLGRMIREATDEVAEIHKDMKEVLDNIETISAPDNIVEGDDPENDDDLKEAKPKKGVNPFKETDEDPESELEEKKRKKTEAEKVDFDSFKEKKGKKKESEDPDEAELVEKKKKKEAAENEKVDDKDLKESLTKRLEALEESFVDTTLALKQEKRYSEQLESKLLKFQESAELARKKSLTEILNER